MNLIFDLIRDIRSIRAIRGKFLQARLNRCFLLECT
jgi:hypothetical protein